MVKERISLTLDQSIVEKIDERLERKGITNRSQGIEELLRDHLKREAVTTAIVLAGGEEPNALIPINGRPVIDHILDHLESAGVEHVYIATGDTDLMTHIDTDRELDIEVVREDEPLGTGGAVKRVGADVNDTFLVINGDVLCSVDFADMKAAHEESGALATLALTTVGDSSNYGVIQMKGSTVVGFEEKPDKSFSKLINAGIYLLEPAFVDRIPDPDDGPVDIETVFEAAAAEDAINGYVHDGEWQEVG